MPLTQLSLRTTAVVDLSPLKGMPLTSLDCSTKSITDLSPLQGMKLTQFLCNSPLITDFKPLQGMPLNTLELVSTQFGDLSILEGMPLTHLDILGCTNVPDLSPLKKLPLVWLRCEFNPERDTEIIRSMKALTTINYKPAAEFWKDVEERKPE